MTQKIYWEGKPSGKVLVLWIFSKFFLLVLLAFIFGGWVLSLLRDFQVTGFAGIVLIFILVLVVITMFMVIYLVLLWQTYHYKITDKGIHSRGGIIVKKQKVVPFYKITNVIISQNILEQILRIGKIGFQTAGMGGTAAPEIRFEGLTDTKKLHQIVEGLMGNQKSKR